MPQVPVTNSFSEVSAYSAVPVEVPDYTRDILAGMRQRQAAEDEAMKEAIRQKRLREEKLNKYKNNLSRWQLTQEKGIWKGRTPEVKALAEDMFQTMQKNLKESPSSYDPESDKELFEKEQNFQRAIDEFQQENKAMTGHMAIALDPKKRDTYNVNDEVLAAWGKGDVEGFRKSLSKNIYGDESRSGEINTYSGVGFLNPIDTTDWHTQTVKAAKGLNVPIREVDLGGGKFKKTQQLSPQEKEEAYQAWTLGAGAKLKKSLIAQAQANNPFFPEEKADEVLKPLFISNIEDNVNLKGSGQAGKSYDDKLSEKIGFSDYQPKGTGTEVRGFNVFFKGSNKGLKSDLQQGNDVLKDVDLKTIYKGADGGLKAIVMQTVSEERPMNDDEKKKEAAAAKMQFREPNFTKTVSSEKPKEIDFSVGSNNYNTILEQYPGVEQKVSELVGAQSSATKAKGAASKEKQWSYNGTTLPESEWINAGWTIEKLKKHAK